MCSALILLGLEKELFILTVWDALLKFLASQALNSCLEVIFKVVIFHKGERNFFCILNCCIKDVVGKVLRK